MFSMSNVITIFRQVENQENWGEELKKGWLFPGTCLSFFENGSFKNGNGRYFYLEIKTCKNKKWRLYLGEYTHEENEFY